MIMIMMIWYRSDRLSINNVSSSLAGVDSLSPMGGTVYDTIMMSSPFTSPTAGCDCDCSGAEVSVATGAGTGVGVGVGDAAWKPVKPSSSSSSLSPPSLLGGDDDNGAVDLGAVDDDDDGIDMDAMSIMDVRLLLLTVLLVGNDGKSGSASSAGASSTDNKSSNTFAVTRTDPTATGPLAAVAAAVPIPS